MRIVLGILKDKLLYANFSKYEFWLDEVRILGHVILVGSNVVDPSKVETILQWKRPKIAIEITNFVGLVGYYRRFIEGFSKIVAPSTQRVWSKNSNHDCNKKSIGIYIYIYTMEERKIK